MASYTAISRALVELTAINDLAGGPRRAEPIIPYEQPYFKYEYGTSAGQINAFYVSYGRSLAATSEELDLRGGVNDPWGTAITFAKVLCLIVRNRNTVAGQVLTMGNATANQFQGPFGAAANTTDIHPAASGYLPTIWQNHAGWTCSAGSRYLKFNSGANTVTYDIMILGQT